MHELIHQAHRAGNWHWFYTLSLYLCYDQHKYMQELIHQAHRAGNWHWFLHTLP